MNLSYLFTNTIRQVYSKSTETILNYVDAPSFKKFHTETVKGEVFPVDNFIGCLLLYIVLPGATIYHSRLCFVFIQLKQLFSICTHA